jgi:AAA domain/Domain of unknown function (DUF6371)
VAAIGVAFVEARAVSIPFDAIASSLLARADGLVREWFPNGKREGAEYRIGNVRGDAGKSLSINLNSGIWRDFATDEGGGDLISLYAASRGISQAEAAKALAPSLCNGYAGHAEPAKAAKPAPVGKPPCDDASALYRYTDGFYVARFDKADGSKSFSPFTWDGSTWNKQAPAKPRPLYGLDDLAARPAAKVLIVEGEKTADAARKLMPVYCVLTWAGGASSVATADWTPVYGREVDIWPDADDPGRKAGANLAGMLLAHCPLVRMVDTSDAAPGWDLADAAADGWDAAKVLEWGKARIAEVKAPASEPKPPPERKPSEREMKRQYALRPLSLGTLADVIGGTYEPKTPLFADDKNAILFPGAYLIVGRPKIGKSWLLLQLALCTTQGDHFLGMVPMRKDIGALMICAEDDEARIKGRLQALGVGMAPRNCYVVTNEEFRFIAQQRSQYQTFPEFLDQWLTENPTVKLIIVDTETTCLQTWLGEKVTTEQNRQITEKDYKQTRRFDDLALKHHAIIGLVNHTSKRKGEMFDIHELINRTNTALAGASGSLVLADMPDADPLDPSNKQRILGARARDMKDDLMLCVQQEKDLPLFTCLGEYIAVQQTQNEKMILEAVEEFQQEDQISGRYYNTAEISEHLGIKRQSVKRAITRMLDKPTGKMWKQCLVEVKRGKTGGIRLIQR